MIDHTTIFSTREFVESWCNAHRYCKPLSVRVRGSGPPRTMYMVQRTRYGSYTISSGSTHCWTSPGWIGELDRITVEGILKQLRGARLRSWLWQVRFDHEPLARALSSFGIPYSRFPIYVLDLDGNYERVFTHYHSTIRNEVRKAARRGVLVRNTCEANDILAYQAIYSNVQQDKMRRVIFPGRMTMDLTKGSELARFMVAEYEGSIIGGLLCLRDGDSVCALHIAHDRRYNHLFPGVALYDAAIRWACEVRADFFNFGHCGSAASGQPLRINQTLAQFKSSWGTRVELNWCFSQENIIWKRLWKRLSILKSDISRRRNRLGQSQQSEAGGRAQLPTELTWAQSAKLGELRAVCYRYASESKNTMLHSASLWAAAKALSITRNQRSRPLTVLDLGCGTGRIIRYFNRRGCTVVGLDVTCEMLEKAKYYGLPEGSFLVLYDGLSFPLKDCSIDLVWSCGVLKYTLFPPGSPCYGLTAHSVRQTGSSNNQRFIPAYSEIAEEIHRVLKPGGVVADYEAWIDESPELFIPGFMKAGFALERVASIRRPYDLLERLCDGRFSTRIGQWAVFRLARLSTKLRYRFDDPKRGGDFVDYFFVWRKPLDREAQARMNFMEIRGQRLYTEQGNKAR